MKIFSEYDKVRDHCHLSGKYRGPANQSCIFIVTQTKNNFIPFPLPIFCSYDCHLFF